MAEPRDEKPIKLLRKKLDDAGVDAHFAELAEHAQAVSVRIKDTRTSLSDASSDQLREVAERLRAGTIEAVQVQFFADDAWWCDTVMRVRDSYRLVRMRQEPD
ncbi:MAG: hypothetical protein P1V51_21915 [Deltaproteobacteria bacterium]|nr:hypothetical protein [Deltaproteobacteria bacterium]